MKLNHHLGNKPEPVAELLAVAPSTIWNWHRRYRASGLSGLVNQAKSGCPAKADNAYLDALAHAIGHDLHLENLLAYEDDVWGLV